MTNPMNSVHQMTYRKHINWINLGQMSGSMPQQLTMKKIMVGKKNESHGIVHLKSDDNFCVSFHIVEVILFRGLNLELYLALHNSHIT